MKAIFDCDGVLFDSNALKVEAFRRTLAPRFEESVVDEFLDHHRANGGVSRYVKFARLVESRVAESDRDVVISGLLEDFSRECVELYRESSLTAGAIECLDWLAPRADVYVASGSDEAELRTVFAFRGLAHRFRGIFGSPTKKEELVRRIVGDSSPEEEVFFVGDAVKDFEAARDSGVPCVLMDRYSDAPAMLRELAENTRTALIHDLRQLPALIESGILWC